MSTRAVGGRHELPEQPDDRSSMPAFELTESKFHPPAALAHQAAAMMQEGHYDDYWTSALVYAWMARVALHVGDVARAREQVARAARLRHLLNHALPVVSVQALLEMARAYLAHADPAGARACSSNSTAFSISGHTSETSPSRRTNCGRSWRASAKASREHRRSRPRSCGCCPSSRPTSPSPRSASGCISRHTVKTQAISVYRKLGVSSRSEAIARMRELGLRAHA